MNYILKYNLVAFIYCKTSSFVPFLANRFFNDMSWITFCCNFRSNTRLSFSYSVQYNVRLSLLHNNDCKTHYDVYFILYRIPLSPV